MLACLTRRGSPLMSPSAPRPPGGPPGSPSAGTAGPFWRDSSHGGPEDRAGRTELIGVAGMPGPPGAPRPGPAVAPIPGPAGAAGETEPPATLRPVHPGNGAGWSAYGTEPWDGGELT